MERFAGNLRKKQDFIVYTHIYTHNVLDSVVYRLHAPLIYQHAHYYCRKQSISPLTEYESPEIKRIEINSAGASKTTVKGKPPL